MATSGMVVTTVSVFLIMSLSIASLNLPPKIQKYILEGDEVVPFDSQESETIFALVNMNHAEATVREIWNTHHIGARMRRHDTKGGCYDGCKCKQPAANAEEYFTALYTQTVTAALENSKAEIEAMESQLGVVIKHITIYESTETSFKIETDHGTFMMEPDKMFLPHDFAKTVFAKIQVVINISNKKLWPVLVSYWIKTRSERVKVTGQTNSGIVDTALKEFIEQTAIETTQKDAEWELEKGNTAIYADDEDTENVYIHIRLKDFVDYLERGKIKIQKNVIASSLQDMGWNKYRLGKNRIHVWSIKTKENPLRSSPESPEAEKQPGESVSLPTL